MNKIRVGLAEDHDLVRQGLVALLEEEDNIEVVFDVPNGAELLEILQSKEIDVLLLDLDMPIINGHEALKVIRAKYSSIQTIIVSMHYEYEFIAESIANGAKGFLPKNCDFDKLVDAIELVHDRGFYFDEKVSQALVTKILTSDEQNKSNQLSEREIEIIVHICDGKKNKEIAEELFISTRTVEGHRNRISEKTKTGNIAELVIYAVKNGIYKINSI